MATVYSIQHTDTNKPSFIINPSQINGFGGPKSNSSLILHGTGRLKYGEALNENFLHLLENFSSPARALPLIVSIQGADDNGGAGVDYVEIFDDKTDIFINDFEFQIVGSTSAINDNNYLVASSSYNQPLNLTTIILQTILPDAQAAFLGNVSYNVVEPDPLMVVPPYNSGQLWFNKTDSVLYIYRDISGTGTFQWDYAGRLGVTVEPPTFPHEGDLWYDQSVPQLKVYTGAAFVSTADRYVLKGGDTITVNDNSVGAIGNAAGVLTFTKDDGVSPSLYINEGHGDISKAPDFRSTDAILMTASETVHIIADSNNNGTGGFVVGKGATDLVSSTDLFHVLNDGTIQSGLITGYESLVLFDNVLTNKKYVDDFINSLSSVYVEKDGDSITSVLPAIGFVGRTDGVLNFDNVLFLNEGKGTVIDGPDIRGTAALLLTADESVLIHIDGDNNSTGGFHVAKGSYSTTGHTPLFKIENDGTIHSDVTNYEALLTNGNDIPNKQYVDDEIAALQAALLGTGGGTFVHANPTVAVSGDIRVTGTGATLEIFIYGSSTWNKVFPAVYST